MITRLNIELEPELSMANACLVLHYLMNAYTTFDFLDDGNGSMLISASCEHCGSPYCGGSHIYIYKQRTSYASSYWANVARLCSTCKAENDAYWDDMWKNVEGY